MRSRAALFVTVLVLSATVAAPTAAALTCDNQSYSFWVDFNADEIVQVDEYRCAPRHPDWSAAAKVDDLPAVPGFAPQHAAVLRAYRTILGREPDLEGARFWLTFVGDENHSVDKVYQLMLASPEYGQSAEAAVADSAFLSNAYSRSFNRPPDAEGLAFWLSALATGEVDRPELLLEFAVSAEMLELNGLTPLWLFALAPPEVSQEWSPQPY